MFIKFICCDVFARIACDLVAKSPHIIDLEFVTMLVHREPDKLRQMIMDMIDRSINESGREYEAVILGFGLCGNSVIGLSCSVPLIIPRAHDCCTIHLGSKEKFIAEFGNVLSSRWCSTGYYERGYSIRSGYGMVDQLENYKTSKEYMDYLDQYDEETAEYLWKTLHPVIESHESAYIKIDGYEYSDSYQNYKARMDKDSIDVRTIDGDVSLLKSLVDGEWDDKRFLTIPPGKKIVGVYDMEYVIEAGD